MGNKSDPSTIAGSEVGEAQPPAHAGTFSNAAHNVTVLRNSVSKNPSLPMDYRLEDERGSIYSAADWHRGAAEQPKTSLWLWA